MSSACNDKRLCDRQGSSDLRHRFAQEPSVEIDNYSKTLERLASVNPPCVDNAVPRQTWSSGLQAYLEVSSAAFPRRSLNAPVHNNRKREALERQFRPHQRRRSINRAGCSTRANRLETRTIDNAQRAIWSL